MNESMQCHVDPSHPVMYQNDDGSWPRCNGCKEDKAKYDAIKFLERKLNGDRYKYEDELKRIDIDKHIYHEGGDGMRGVKTCPVNASHGLLWKNNDGSWQKCTACRSVIANRKPGERVVLESFEYVKTLVGRGTFDLGESDKSHSQHTVFFHSISDQLLSERKKKVDSEDNIPVWFLVTNFLVTNALSEEQAETMRAEYGIMTVPVPNVDEARRELEEVVAKS